MASCWNLDLSAPSAPLKLHWLTMFAEVYSQHHWPPPCPPLLLLQMTITATGTGTGTDTGIGTEVAAGMAMEERQKKTAVDG